MTGRWDTSGPPATRCMAFLAAVLSVTSLATGCSALLAFSGSSTPDLGAIRVGSTRAEVERRLGRSVSSAVDGDGTSTAVYEYERGSGPDVGRGLTHVLGDIATLGLWEVAGITIEARQRRTYRVTIVYGRDDHVVAVDPATVTGAIGPGSERTLLSQPRAPGPSSPEVTSAKNEAVAENVERYALLLQERHDDALAAFMRDRAQQLRDALGDTSGPSYLGFNPSQILRQYAALLCELGRGSEASEIQELADWRERAQVEQFTRSQGGRP